MDATEKTLSVLDALDGASSRLGDMSALTVELSFDDAVALGTRVVEAADAVSQALGARPG